MDWMRISRTIDHVVVQGSGDDARRRAVPGPRSDGVEAAFTRWFGDTEAFEVVDTEVGVIGARLGLRWRVRLRAERVGPGWRVVEQQAYADLDGDHLSALSLVCTGYLAEATDG